MDFLETHPYLVANVPLLAVMLVVATLARPRDYRKLSLLSGLVCVPGAFLALAHNGSYWSPSRLGGGRLGVEDPVVMFIDGVMVWLLAALPSRRRLVIDSRPRTLAERGLIYGALFGALCLLLWGAGVESLENTLAAGVAAFVVLVVVRRDLWPLTATGLALFVPAYVVIVKTQFLIWPDYVSQWNPASPLGAMVLGMPVGEVAFAIVFAACWPVYVACLFGVRLRRSEGRLVKDR